MKSFFVILLFVLLLGNLHANDKPVNKGITIQDLQLILHDLYEATSDHSISEPRIEIVDQKEKVASYNSAKHTIKIEQSLLDVCQSLGTDAKNAIAFIIAHELTHAFQLEFMDHKHEFHFLDYSKNQASSIRIETTADIQGAFTSYLAGYTNHHLIPELLELVYYTYGLDETKMTNYPSLAERKRIGRNVEEKVDQLISINELAIYLSLLGEHNTATHLFEHISEYYPGTEIYQNIAVNYVLEAMNFTTYNVDKFAYPLEFESETRLSKPLKPGGSKDLSMEEYKQRTTLLNKAIKHLEIAKSKLDNNPAICNQLASVYVLKEEPQVALTILAQLDLLSETDNEYGELIKAIALASTNQFYAIEKARELLISLSKSKNSIVKNRALFNLHAMNGESSNCRELVNVEDHALGQIDLKKVNSITFESVLKDDDLKLKKGLSNPLLSFYQLRVNNKLNIIQIKKIDKSDKYHFTKENIKHVISFGNVLALKSSGPEPYLHILNNDKTSHSIVSIIN